MPTSETKSSLPNNSIRAFLRHVLPKVSLELNRWQKKLDYCQSHELKYQALSSLRNKRFHAQGGSFFALYHPNYAHRLIPLLVAIQTISDYLDNLCDRTNFQSEAAFRNLHLSFLDALDPHKSTKESYYCMYPYKMDGGYLNSLVEECQTQIKLLPSYDKVKNKVIALATLYCDLQVYKHLDPMIRKSRLKRWFREKGFSYQSELYWWEFAAACGSTLGIFALISLATRVNISEDEVKQLLDTYFPWVCGLHILLDYFIDQQEDLLEGDLNFVACYPSPLEQENRMFYFFNKALQKVSRLPSTEFHATIIQGLPAVYLSDPKAGKPIHQSASKKILKPGGLKTLMMQRLCMLLRRTNVLGAPSS